MMGLDHVRLLTCLSTVDVHSLTAVLDRGEQLCLFGAYA